jgi:FkbH-like protein
MLTDLGFRTPRDLEVTAGHPRRVLVIGSCLIAAIPENIQRHWAGCEADWITLNNLQPLPDQPPQPLDTYDFQVIQTSTRAFWRDSEHLMLSQECTHDWQQLQATAVERLRLIMDELMRYNRERGLLTFVANFFVPTFNPAGRLLHHNDHRNLIFFFVELNRALASIVSNYDNAYILDVDAIAASLGKRYILDEAMWISTHNAVYGVTDDPLDGNRMEPVAPQLSKFESKAYEFVLECLHELRASYRSVRAIDAVKMVVTDLDDTLWRGVSGEWDGPVFTDGWPNGYAEALAFLRQRGVLLAVISKNDPQTVMSRWSSLLPPEQFSVQRINWSDKPTNMQEVLATTNLLPHNVLFIDDNPAEREAMQAAYPTMRVIGADPHVLRRILLWSPELQGGGISHESAQRSAMVEGQIRREAQRLQLDRSSFLAGLQLRLSPLRLTDMGSDSAGRCLELINKTNQFNTTGERWTHEALAAALAGGAQLWGFDITDVHTPYGITAVAILEPGLVRQLVVSCRVFGLGIEETVLQLLARAQPWPDQTFSVIFNDTGRNQVALQNLTNAGLLRQGNRLQVVVSALQPIPDHVTVKAFQPAPAT